MNLRYGKMIKLPLLALLGATCGQLFAQSVTSTFVGTVKDPSGASVIGAQITLQDQQTGFIRTTKSDSHGDYEFTIVNPGTYTVSAEVTGFKTFSDSNIILPPRFTQRLDIRLEVGQVTESVKVSGEAPVVNTDSAQMSETRSAKVITEGAAGTEIMQRFGYNTVAWSLSVQQGTGVEDNYKAMGSRSTMFETSLDGNAIAASQLSPPDTAMQAQKLVTVNASAEYRAPLVIDADTKQGTNQFHGSYTVFFQHPALNSLPPGPPGAVRGAQVPQWKQNITGGGPVWIPKIYDGRNKTFFFISAERTPPVNVTYPLAQYGIAGNVPTLAMRQGNFAPYFANDPSKTGLQLIDPLNGKPFAGNVIPPSRWNPAAAKAVNQFYPLPNESLGNNPNVPFENLDVLYHETDVNSRWTWRVDQNFGSRNTTGFVYTATPNESVGLLAPWWNLLPTQGSYNQAIFSHNYSWYDTQIITPNIVNEVRLGLFMINSTEGETETASTVINALGIDLGPDSGQRTAHNVVPNLNITGYTQIGSLFPQSDSETNWYTFRDNLSWKKGRHTLKFGYDQRFKRLDQDTAVPAVAGEWNFTGSWTGDAFADFLLGLPQSTLRYTPGPLSRQRYNELGLYAQDDFPVSKNLTLNLGFRFDRISPRVDKSQTYFSFNPANGNLVVPNQQSLALVNPAWPTSVVPIQLASDGGYPAELTNPLRFLSPRVGLAWRPFGNDKTAVRAGYGIFATDQGSYTNNFATLQTGGPFALTETFLNPTSGAPLVTLDHPFPATVGQVPASFTITAVDPHIKTPYMQQWNISIEHALLPNLSARISYVGAKTTQVWYEANINAPPASLIPFTTSRFVYPGFNSIYWLTSGGNDSFNSLQFAVTHRFRNGLFVDSLFQWEKELSDVFDSGGYTVIQNPYDRAQGRGKEILSPLEFRAQFTYELPFGPGKQLANSVRKGSFLSGLIGGWQVSGFIELRDGRPFDVTFSGADPSNTGSFGGIVSVLPNCDTRPSNGIAGPYLNINCFTVPASGGFGNLGRNTFLGPGYRDFDATVYKFLPISFLPGVFGENVRLRFSISAQNALNNINWGNVQSNISQAGFGSLFSEAYGRQVGGQGNRNVQLCAQLQW